MTPPYPGTASRKGADAWRIAMDGVRLSEVVSALSFALDITEGQPPGHAVRTCLIGMRLADVVGLAEQERAELFYALLLKDLGCSSNAARLSRLFEADDLLLKHVHKLTDWTDGRASARYAFRHARPGSGAVARAVHTLKLGFNEKGSGREMTRTRCERGAEIAGMLGLERQAQEAIRALDEHWDGRGMPYGLSGTQIPLLARICSLAQTVEVFHAAYGVDAAYEMAAQRRGRWFEPALVDALRAFREDYAFWDFLASAEALDHVAELEPGDRLLRADEERLDQVALAFARVIDAKSPYTARHSEGVAAVAVALGEAMGMGEEGVRTLRRAGLLHDIGKLGISNLILDKPGKLTDEEFVEMKKHPRFTAEILGRVRRFSEFAGIAAAHHERIDGKGYHQGIGGDRLDQASRILAVADVCEALSAERPYRAALPRAEVESIMGRMAGPGLCEAAFEALRGLADWPVGSK